MTSLSFAVYLTCLVLWRKGLGTNLPGHVHQDSGFMSADVGGNVTLQCFYQSNVAAVFLWYKQSLGQKPKLLSRFYKHDKVGTFSDEFKNNSRLSLETQNGKNHLTISDLHISDSATYYCVSCSSYKFEFGEGITVSVRGSGLNIQTSVRQSASETIQPGDPETLSCTVHTGTCDGEHSVYWFRNQLESHPGLIYTDGGRNDQRMRKPNTPTQTCVYNLPMNLSHAGAHDCAVASCRHIVFGDDGMNSIKHLVFFLSGALALTIILNVLMAFLLHKMRKKNPWQRTDTNPRYSEPSTANTEGHQDADNLHYAALREHRFNASRKQREDTSNQCVYSSVK
ncbi:uncharacterized protein LOC103361188 [Stegastes partitus]|uniref:Uncharacterized protein LOC103361188 n=1 Tax=Stegastes partitus TaxID=144197 RepID=A0A9Y4K6W5_9TELE|nr:PREDICTED: uncharacterized protein LOC103361188 [Stegastes partitus]